MSNENEESKLEVEKIAEGFFSRLKEVFVEVIEDVAKVVAKKEPETQAPRKLGIVKGTGTDGKADAEAKTDPPPTGEERSTTNLRTLRPVT